MWFAYNMLEHTLSSHLCFPPFRESYLFNQTSWAVCVRPQNVAMWNVVLFSILLCIGTLEAVLLLAQVVNGLIGCLCGTCMNKNQVCLLSMFILSAKNTKLLLSNVCNTSLTKDVLSRSLQHTQMD